MPRSLISQIPMENPKSLEPRYQVFTKCTPTSHPKIWDMTPEEDEF